jgi:hypothetical protein
MQKHFMGVCCNSNTTYLRFAIGNRDGGVHDTSDTTSSEHFGNKERAAGELTITLVPDGECVGDAAPTIGSISLVAQCSG